MQHDLRQRPLHLQHDRYRPRHHDRWQSGDD
jgi:hypothetical protein